MAGQQLPFAARIPLDEGECNTLWVNQHGDVKHRDVVGSKILIRQQPAAPPKSPEILLLSDEIVANYPRPEKYVKCLAMFGYTMRNYLQDIKDDLIDLNFPYILIYIGTMQLGVFQHQILKQDVTQLVEEVVRVTPNSLIVFSGVVPRPVDHQQSRNRCISFNKVLQMVVNQLRQDKHMNCMFLDPYSEFLDAQGKILDPHTNFQDELYLTEIGIRNLRAMWLCHLGYFPKKPGK